MSHSFRTLDRVSQSNVDPNGLYKYSSRPRLVEVRCKPRQPPVFHHVLRPAKQTQQQYGNIMYDHRVVRGIAQHIIPSTSQPGSAEIQRQSSIRRGGTAGRRAVVQLGPRTPEPVQGRQHIDVQTDLYLEELSEVIATTDTESQTDEFLDRPATPLFIPVKSGKDAETQIEEGELFDFDSEVQPVLEVLVGKTIEQSLLEVMEEEELASLRAQQKAFRELRNNELAEVQRLQEQERRLTEEKKRRIAQQKEMLMIERETVEKVNALEFSQQYLADLLPAVFSSLRRQGVFYDPVEKEIKNNFFSWLMAEVHNKIQNRNTVRMLLDTISYEACENGLKEIKDQETQPARIDS